MIKFLSGLFFLLTVLPNTENVISWKTDTKLTWSDFKGKAEAQAGVVALTASGITFSFSIQESNTKIVNFDALVEAHFYPEKSWVINERANDHILAHEQLHFDLTELHVRKLRQQISRLKVSSHIKEDLRRLHEEAKLALAEMQNDYDTQTRHSMQIEKQAYWDVFIQAEMEKLREFKSE